MLKSLKQMIITQPVLAIQSEIVDIKAAGEKNHLPIDKNKLLLIGQQETLMN